MKTNHKCPECNVEFTNYVGLLSSRENLTCGKPECRKAQRNKRQQERRFKKWFFSMTPKGQAFYLKRHPSKASILRTNEAHCDRNRLQQPGK